MRPRPRHPAKPIRLGVKRKKKSNPQANVTTHCRGPGAGGAASGLPRRLGAWTIARAAPSHESLYWQSADVPSGLEACLNCTFRRCTPCRAPTCDHSPQVGRYGSNRPCRCSYAFTGTWRRFRFQNRANQAVAGSRTPRAFLAGFLPAPPPPQRNGLVFKHPDPVTQTPHQLPRQLPEKVSCPRTRTRTSPQPAT